MPGRYVATCPASLERLEQLLAHLGRERLLGKVSERVDRLPHLVDVVAAALADGEVGLEPLHVEVGQPFLEIVGDELDQLVARQLV